ncbi:unnamed protein product [Rotaria sordida]|uniref:FYVE-type domain-containing protein n=1 Tax=Rotaria sordida TaxID=392033 RepID=A0A819G9L8_9BILA|nr:unnamed protein product [Rotaria sordida]CAF3882466.1 unnamed protein product [Rotaria sordida]
MQPQATALTEPIIRPPSPDFSSLTPDELNQLEIVLQKQVLIENEQNQCLSGLRRTMVHLQQTIENDHQRQRHSSSINSYNSSPTTQQNQILLSSSDIIQCYICYSKIEIQSKDLVSSLPILCADCHRPVCRRCGNYTSPECINISDGNNFENQTHISKWRCRTCIVRREVIRKSGMFLSKTKKEEEEKKN